VDGRRRLVDPAPVGPHGGRILAGVYTRVAARLLALAAAIWHNWHNDAPVKRSLIAYDH
jgi:hypothetical protein